MTVENIDTRVLGGIRLVDAITRAEISGQARIESDQAQFFRNRSGLYVIRTAKDLEELATFELPDPQPEPGSVKVGIRIVQADRDHLGRRAEIVLPLAGAARFEPQEIPLLPSPSAPVPPGCAAVRASVEKQKKGIAGALVRAVRNGKTIGTGMTDERGEALVVVPGLRAAANGDAPPVAVEVVRPPEPGLQNPDELKKLSAAAATAQPAEFSLAAGGTAAVAIELS